MFLSYVLYHFLTFVLSNEFGIEYDGKIRYESQDSQGQEVSYETQIKLPENSSNNIIKFERIQPQQEQQENIIQDSIVDREITHETTDDTVANYSAEHQQVVSQSKQPTKKIGSKEPEKTGPDLPKTITKTYNIKQIIDTSRIDQGGSSSPMGAYVTNYSPFHKNKMTNNNYENYKSIIMDDSDNYFEYPNGHQLPISSSFITNAFMEQFPVEEEIIEVVYYDDLSTTASFNNNPYQDNFNLVAPPVYKQTPASGIPLNKIESILKNFLPQHTTLNPQYGMNTYLKTTPYQHQNPMYSSNEEYGLTSKSSNAIKNLVSLASNINHHGNHKIGSKNRPGSQNDLLDSLFKSQILIDFKNGGGTFPSNFGDLEIESFYPPTSKKPSVNVKQKRSKPSPSSEDVTLNFKTKLDGSKSELMDFKNSIKEALQSINLEAKIKEKTKSLMNTKMQKLNNKIDESSDKDQKNLKVSKTPDNSVNVSKDDDKNLKFETSDKFDSVDSSQLLNNLTAKLKNQISKEKDLLQANNSINQATTQFEHVNPALKSFNKNTNCTNCTPKDKNLQLNKETNTGDQSQKQENSESNLSKLISEIVNPDKKIGQDIRLAKSKSNSINGTAEIGAAVMTSAVKQELTSAAKDPARSNAVDGQND